MHPRREKDTPSSPPLQTVVSEYGCRQAQCKYHEHEMIAGGPTAQDTPRFCSFMAKGTRPPDAMNTSIVGSQTNGRSLENNDGFGLGKSRTERYQVISTAFAPAHIFGFVSTETKLAAGGQGVAFDGMVTFTCKNGKK